MFTWAALNPSICDTRCDIGTSSHHRMEIHWLLMSPRKKSAKLISSTSSGLRVPCLAAAHDTIVCSPSQTNRHCLSCSPLSFLVLSLIVVFTSVDTLRSYLLRSRYCSDFCRSTGCTGFEGRYPDTDYWSCLIRQPAAAGHAHRPPCNATRVWRIDRGRVGDATDRACNTHTSTVEGRSHGKGCCARHRNSVRQCNRRCLKCVSRGAASW